jgi:energy-coupling factor transport system permease protein
VNVAPRYLGRGSWLARRDPRVLLLMAVFAAATVPQVLDVRIALVLLAIALAYYRTAAIPWRAVRGSWGFVLVFLSVLVVFNTIIAGGETTNIPPSQLHVLFRLPLLGTPISAEAVSYGATQMVRYLSFTAVGFPIAYAVAPGDIGASLARLRIPDKFAVGVDLTFRFIPSLAGDLHTTADAQRVRGYDWDRGGRGPIARLRRMGPIVVPLTLNAIVNAEDTIDAMDLRAFGTGKRTWLRKLSFDASDKLLLAAAASIFVAITALNLLGYTRLWVIPFLIDLAR